MEVSWPSIQPSWPSIPGGYYIRLITWSGYKLDDCNRYPVASGQWLDHLGGNCFPFDSLQGDPDLRKAWLALMLLAAPTVLCAVHALPYVHRGC